MFAPSLIIKRGEGAWPPGGPRAPPPPQRPPLVTSSVSGDMSLVMSQNIFYTETQGVEMSEFLRPR